MVTPDIEESTVFDEITDMRVPAENEPPAPENVAEEAPAANEIVPNDVHEADAGFDPAAAQRIDADHNPVEAINDPAAEFPPAVVVEKPEGIVILCDKI